MALTENRIGPYPFVSLRGKPIAPMQATIVDDRPGVDGSEKVLAGKKGRPFSLVSGVDIEAYSGREVYMAAYATLIDADAQTLVQGGINHDGAGYRVLVLAVELEDCKPITTATGNRINLSAGASGAWLEVRWDLLSVPFEA